MSEESGGETGAAPDLRRARIDFVRVRLNSATYALELGRVERVLSEPELTRVPRSPAAIAGVAAVRNDIVSVVEGRTVLGLEPRPAEFAPKLLVLDRGRDEPTAGLLVDDVVGIDTHHVESIAPVAERENWRPEVGRSWFRAVVDADDRSMGVLDVSAVLAAATDSSHLP